MSDSGWRRERSYDDTTIHPKQKKNVCGQFHCDSFTWPFGSLPTKEPAVECSNFARSNVLIWKFQTDVQHKHLVNSQCPSLSPIDQDFRHSPARNAAGGFEAFHQPLPPEERTVPGASWASSGAVGARPGRHQSHGGQRGQAETVKHTNQTHGTEPREIKKVDRTGDKSKSLILLTVYTVYFQEELII